VIARTVRYSLVAAAVLLAGACGEGPPVDGVRTEVTARAGSDSALVRVRWSARDTGLVFPWRYLPAGADEGSILADTTAGNEAVFQVELPAADQEAEFCLRGLRVVDGKTTGEACTEYVIPAEPPPLPEPGTIHIALVHLTEQYRNPICLEREDVCRRRDDSGECTRWRNVCTHAEPRDTLGCLTLRWDSVPGAVSFAAELRSASQLVSRSDVNDDSCPACADIDIQGSRWPCFDFQDGCRFNVWPYFSAAWCVKRSPNPQPFEVRIRALAEGETTAAEEAVEWTVPGRESS